MGRWRGYQANGHFAYLQPWEMMFFYIAIAHCEGPDHLARMHKLEDAVELVIKELPDQLRESGPRLRAQHQKVKKIIATYARYPHRNDILSRHSIPEEDLYISAGNFLHRANSGP
ncbi:DUF924 family protein [Yoonia vestfoldensis]|uniref:DUF924 family protein n=1 Tax=Yoonia vestfoldensis TaxID=245188 RepID=UPI000DA1E76E|nr:DUF924 family protein [Yoonia vestfoldensis]